MTSPERRSQHVRVKQETPPAPRSEVPVTVLTVLSALAGASLIGWGVWLIYQPAAFVFAGAMLWLGALRVARERKEKPDAAKNG